MFARLALAIPLFVACTSASSTGIPPVTCPPDSTLTYENFGRQLVTTECLSCHRDERPVLTSVDQIRSYADAILEAAVYTDAMPEDRGMPLTTREQLGEWIACGAP